MKAADYDAWYDTPRGAWIGETEYALVRHAIDAAPRETLLDVGCGTGWFTRCFAQDGLLTAGLDPNPEWLAYARAHSDPCIRWVEGDAQRLPFDDRSFDCAVSVAALCFVPDERRAVAEIVRVARRRIAIGWLNRSSPLYHQKAGRGAYRGAAWHTADEVRGFFAELPVTNLKLTSAVFLPAGGPAAKMLEGLLPNSLTWGALLVAAADKAQC